MPTLQEVVGEAVDEVQRRPREGAVVVAAQRRHQLALGHRPGWRVEEGHQQVAVLVAQRAE
jgi:hypothetical protein